MDKLKQQIYTFGFLLAVNLLPACTTEKDDDSRFRHTTALVTVRPAAASFVLQLDDTTTLHPVNLRTSPFGNKEVRALVNYTDEGGTDNVRNIRVLRIDSIRTKLPVPSLGVENDAKYGSDAIEIVKDWVTVAEDGYLTLRIRTRWGALRAVHRINLLTGVNPDNPYELELRHDARGDIGGYMGDALIAFNLNSLPVGDLRKVKLKLKLNWQSFSGKKSAEFDLSLRTENQKSHLLKGSNF